jgi:hypothetical protein
MQDWIGRADRKPPGRSPQTLSRSLGILLRGFCLLVAKYAGGADATLNTPKRQQLDDCAEATCSSTACASRQSHRRRKERAPARARPDRLGREGVTEYHCVCESCRDARQTIRKPCLIGPPSVLYPAMRAARVDDNVRHALKALRVGLDFGRNFLAGLGASNHKNAHLSLTSHPVHARA